MLKTRKGSPWSVLRINYRETNIEGGEKVEGLLQQRMMA